MILEVLTGLFVSIVIIVSFLFIKFIYSMNNWIIETSKFIYFSGHPLLDDDEVYIQITKRFKSVFISLTIVILKIIIIFIIIIGAIALSSLFVSFIKGEEIPKFKSTEILSFYFPKYLINFPFIIGSLLPIIFIPFLKKKKRKNILYSPMEKFLHYTFLGNKNIARFLFKSELWFNRKKLKTIKPNQNVYISGMARAGTTALMQYLGQLQEFKSLSYRNLPFLFLPKTGLKFNSKKKIQEKERFHQDGIKHSLDSYEALEEPFWRNYIGENYIFDKTIISHTLNQKLFSQYNSFRRLISGNKIYLSKNNNHLLRADSIHELDKINGNITKTIIPFREPYEQSKSLLKQHQLLSSLQKEDEFTLDYMDFLVHHEFGLHHKISVIKDNIDLSISNQNIDTVDYWIEIWYLFYSQVYQIFSEKENIYFFCYKNFANQPKKSLEDLLTVLDLPKSLIDSISIKEFITKTTKPIDELNSKYLDLYKKLKLISLNNYG